MSQDMLVNQMSLQELLRKSEIAEIRVVELDRVGSQVLLRGVVSSFYHKQLAQELIRAKATGLEIENQICVEYSRSQTEPDAMRLSKSY